MIIECKFVTETETSLVVYIFVVENSYTFTPSEKPNIQKMYVLDKTDDYEGFTNNTQTIDDEKVDLDIFIKLLILSIPGGVLLLSLIGLIIRTIIKPWFS